MTLDKLDKNREGERGIRNNGKSDRHESERYIRMKNVIQILDITCMQQHEEAKTGGEQETNERIRRGQRENERSTDR